MITHAHLTTRVSRVLVGLAVLFVLTLLADSGSCASDSDTARATLRGLPGVFVAVEALAPAVERAGLTTHQLHTDVEFQLRQAGLRLLTKEEWLIVTGQPFVYVNVQVFLPPQGQAAYHISTECYQRASLDAHASSALVATWTTAYLGLVDVNALHTLRDHVRAYVDQFINAYYSVNSRPAGSAAPAATSPHRDLIRHVQERLQAGGFNPGTIDGTMGPQTRDALRQFQNTKGLLATGDLDDHSLDALGVR